MIGVVGGVGSGKSYVAEQVHTKLTAKGVPAEIIDGDRIGHETLANPDVVKAIGRRFGSDIIADGEIDRRRLGGLVFGESSEHEQNRLDLEAIVHPIMRREFAKRITAASNNEAVVLFDAAVLFETGWDDLCNAYLYVDAQDVVRSNRAAARGWPEDRWIKTEASQWPLDKKRRLAESLGNRSLVVTNDIDESADISMVVDWISHHLLDRSTTDVSSTGLTT